MAKRMWNCDYKNSLCATKFVSSVSVTAEAKAAEAAASAYYNPVNPHNVYMPTVSAEIKFPQGFLTWGRIRIMYKLHCRAALAVLLSDTAKCV